MTASVTLTEISIKGRHVDGSMPPKYIGTVKLRVFSESVNFDFETQFDGTGGGNSYDNIEQVSKHAASELRKKLIELLTEVLKMDGGPSDQKVSISS